MRFICDHEYHFIFEDAQQFLPVDDIAGGFIREKQPVLADEPYLVQLPEDGQEWRDAGAACDKISFTFYSGSLPRGLCSSQPGLLIATSVVWPGINEYFAGFARRMQIMGYGSYRNDFASIGHGLEIFRSWAVASSSIAAEYMQKLPLRCHGRRRQNNARR